MKRIFFLSEEKAYYPEIDAYISYFSRKGFVCIRVAYSERENFDFYDSIVWIMMGFYPRNIRAKFVVHDYRSLSVGAFPRVKNYIKSKLNSKPDLRIFLNDLVEEDIRLNDNIPSYKINMGVSEGFLISPAEYLRTEKKYDFCYVGEISRERGIDELIAGFRRAYGRRKRLLLVGEPKNNIQCKYESDNIIFVGRKKYCDIPKYLCSSMVGISFVPNVYPYNKQTQTKMIEYNSVGCMVLANKSKGMSLTSREYEVEAIEVEGIEFPSESDLLNLYREHCRRLTLRGDVDYTWDYLIEKSGVLGALQKIY